MHTRKTISKIMAIGNDSGEVVRCERWQIHGELLRKDRFLLVE